MVRRAFPGPARKELGAIRGVRLGKGRRRTYLNQLEALCGSGHLD